MPSTKSASILLIALAMLGANRADAASITDGFTLPDSSAFTYGRYTTGLIPSSFSSFSEQGDLDGLLGKTGKYAGLKYAKSPSGLDPNVIYNSTENDILTAPDYDSITFKSHKITFGPYLGPTVARFTASTSGYYKVSALFTPVQVGNGLPSYYIAINGNLSPALPTPISSATTPYNGIVQLAAGGTIDFVVFGGNTSNKTTQVEATVEGSGNTQVAAVPEPASVAMLSTAGLVILSLAGIRRRKARIAMSRETTSLPR